MRALLAKAWPKLKEFLPAGMAAKGVGGLDKRTQRFLVGALGSGYALDEVGGFLSQMTESPQEAAMREDFRQRRDQGIALSGEKASIAQDERGERAGQMLKKGAQVAVGAAAGGLMGGIPGAVMGAAEQAMPDKQPDERNYFQRAMEGVSFFDLDESIKPKVGAIKSRLDEMEAQGVPWEDKTVQKLAQAVRSLAGAGGMVEQESARVEQRQMQGSADDLVAMGLQQAENEIRKLLGR